MRKLEAECQTKFNHWLRTSFKKTGAYELKIAREGRLAFNRLLPHQKQWLQAVQNGVAVHKLPDDTIGFKPFDCFCFAEEAAYVVAIFYPQFYLIDIFDWIQEETTSSWKSLDEARTKKIASFEASFLSR